MPCDALVNYLMLLKNMMNYKMHDEEVGSPVLSKHLWYLIEETEKSYFSSRSKAMFKKMADRLFQQQLPDEF